VFAPAPSRTGRPAASRMAAAHRSRAVDSGGVPPLHQGWAPLVGSASDRHQVATRSQMGSAPGAVLPHRRPSCLTGYRRDHRQPPVTHGSSDPFRRRACRAPPLQSASSSLRSSRRIRGRRQCARPPLRPERRPGPSRPAGAESCSWERSRSWPRSRSRVVRLLPHRPRWRSGPIPSSTGATGASGAGGAPSTTGTTGTTATTGIAGTTGAAGIAGTMGDVAQATEAGEGTGAGEAGAGAGKAGAGAGKVGAGAAADGDRSSSPDLDGTGEVAESPARAWRQRSS
jgi:hypothetical protein